MSKHTTSTFVAMLLAVALATAFDAAPLDALAPHDPPASCRDALVLTPGETWRDPGAFPDGACFTVQAEVADLVAIEVSQDAFAPRVHIADFHGTEPAVSLRHRSATVVIATATEGTLWLRVVPDDPSGDEAPFRLTVSASPQTRDEDDSEIEVEPDPVAFPPSRRQTTIEHAFPGIADRNARGLCGSDRRPAGDDHADDFLCATALTSGSVSTGRLGNPRGDDRDVFQIDVESIRPIGLVAAGEVAMVAELFDRSGLRLDVVEGDDEGLRWVRTLVPGTYFLRLTSRDGSSGTYLVGLDLAGR